MKKDHFMLWSLLAVAFFIFLGLSMCGDIHVGAWHLKSSGMADSLLAVNDRPATSTADTPADTTPAVETADSQPRESAPHHIAADTTATNLAAAPQQQADSIPHDKKVVLFIGDSMVECLGPRMAAYCNASGYSLYNVIWYSSGTERYAKNHLISDYIKRLHPDFIFLSLGGNELFIKDIKQKRDGYVKSILAEIGDIPYLWIGPPNWKPDTGINDLIASNVKPGCMFVSNGLKLGRKKDGAHPDAPSSIIWMDSIAAWMPAHSRYKLPFATPTQKTGRSTKQFLHKPGETP